MNPPPDSTSKIGGMNPIAIVRGVEYRCGDCGAKNIIKGGGTFHIFFRQIYYFILCDM